MSPDFPDDELASVAYSRGAREARDFSVRDFCRRSELVGESAEAGPEDESDARTKFGFGVNEFCGACSVGEFGGGRSDFGGEHGC